MQWVAGVAAAAIAVIGAWFFMHRPPMPPGAMQSQNGTSTIPMQQDQAQAMQQAPMRPSATSSTSTKPSNLPTTPTHISSTTTPATTPVGEDVDMTKLPLGDYKYTTSGPKKGYIYLCHVAQGGGGAQVDGPWIHGTTWDATAKVSVQGAVSWPSAYFRTAIAGDTRTVQSADLPVNGTTGNFPVAASDPAAAYDRNPNSISAQDLSISIPASPVAAAQPGCIYGEVGIMTNGVELLDGFDAEYRDAPAHEVQDSCDGHPHGGGEYHYHNLSSCITDRSSTHIIGWAYDGFPITGPLLPDGKNLETADLDECHGMTSAIMENGKTVTTYHYVMTYDFPYSVSCFRGVSHEPRPTGGPQGGQGMQGAPSMR